MLAVQVQLRAGDAWHKAGQGFAHKVRGTPDFQEQRSPISIDPPSIDSS